MTATTRANAPTRTFSAVREYPAAAPDDARRHFLARLSVETDPADLVHDLVAGTGNLVIIDARGPEHFARCHIRGARNLPHRQISAETTADIDRNALLVTYCWGPSCNASMRAAAKLAALGFAVKELTGGLEYWRKEGCPVEGSEGAEAPLYWQHA